MRPTTHERCTGESQSLQLSSCSHMRARVCKHASASRGTGRGLKLTLQSAQECVDCSEQHADRCGSHRVRATACCTQQSARPALHGALGAV